MAPIYGTFTYRAFATNLIFYAKYPRLSNEIELYLNTEFTYEVIVNGEKISQINKIVQDRITGGSYRNYVIPLPRTMTVNSIKLQSIDAFYVGDASANIILDLKVNDLNEP